MQARSFFLFCLFLFGPQFASADVIYNVNHFFSATQGIGDIQLTGSVTVAAPNAMITSPAEVTAFDLTWSNPGGSLGAVNHTKGDAAGTDFLIIGDAFLAATPAGLFFQVPTRSDFGTNRIHLKDNDGMGPGNDSISFLLTSSNFGSGEFSSVFSTRFGDGATFVEATMPFTETFQFGTTAVPEPGSIALLTLLAGTSLLRRRRTHCP